MYRPKGKELRKKVYQIVVENWPIHASGICRKLHLDTTVSNISKIKYHLDVLKKNNKVHAKKIDRALVVWPSEIDKIRVVHEFMRDV